MATKNIVPNSDGEGKLGTSSKSWAEGHIDSITGTIATAAQTNITSVGALNGGTITSGFGAINNGASAITTTGLISGGSLDIDNVLINGTTIGHTDDTNLMTLADGVLTIAGELDAVSLDISGNADIDGTLEADAITVDGTALNTVIAGVTVTNATNSSHVLVTDNESTSENNLITFVEGATSSTGNVGLEMDGNLTYNPSTGTVTATAFAGALTGNVTGNASGTAATVTGAAQSNITSLGTLTGLTLSGNIILPQTGVIAFNSTSDEYITAAADQLFLGTGNLARLTLDNSNATFTGNIKIPDSGTIGCASDTDLLTLGDQSLTVAGKSDITTSLTGFASTITNNKDDSQGLLVRTSDNDGGEYILDLQSSSTSTGTDYASKFNVAKGGNATFAGGVGIAGASSLPVSNSKNGAGIQIPTNKQLGFGNGASSKPDFGFAVDGTSGDAKLEIFCGTGGDEVDAFFNTSGLFKAAALQVANDGAIGSVGTAGAITIASDGLATFSGIGSFGGGSGSKLNVGSDSDGAFLEATNSKKFRILTGGASNFQIDSTGLVQFQAGMDTSASRGVFLVNQRDINNNNFLQFRKSRGVGSGVDLDDGGIVTAGDFIGQIDATAAHATDSFSTSSRIIFKSTNTINATNGVPGLISFQTNPSSSTANREVMLINANGQIDGDFNDTSDEALKENIADSTKGISIVKQLKSRSFDWKEPSASNNNIGFVAQEVETVLPEVVFGENYAVDDNGDKISSKTINVTGIVSVLTKAMQEQQVIIEDLKSRIETLEG